MKCKKCGLEKQLKQFIKNKNCKNGHAGICKECSNNYSKKWKKKHSKELSEKRRKLYAQTEGLKVKKRIKKRKKLYPLRCRATILRQGMAGRSKRKKIEFDKNFFTVNYLMERLSKSPFCECCRKKLDIEFKQDKKFNDNSPSMDRVNPNNGYTKENTAILCWRCNKHKQDATSKELRIIADFIDTYGNEVESDIEL